MKSEKEKLIKSIRKELKTTESDIKKSQLRMKLKSLKKDIAKEEILELVS